jgi:hypothetical protein
MFIRAVVVCSFTFAVKERNSLVGGFGRGGVGLDDMDTDGKSTQVELLEHSLLLLPFDYLCQSYAVFSSSNGG